MKKKTKFLLGAGLAASLGAAGVYTYYFRPLKTKEKRTKYPYALLLGCPSHDDGTYSSSQIERCNLAIEEYKRGAYKTLIITGGAVKNQYTESLAMKEYIEKRAFIPVIAETKAANTYENFEFAKNIIHDQPVLILTSSLHAKRCQAIASKFFTHFAFAYYPDRKPRHIVREIFSRFIFIKIELEKALGLYKKKN